MQRKHHVNHFPIRRQQRGAGFCSDQDEKTLCELHVTQLTAALQPHPRRKTVAQDARNGERRTHVVQPTGDTPTFALRQLGAVGCGTRSPKTTTAGEPDCSDYDDLWPATWQMCTPESTCTCEERRPCPALQKALVSRHAFTFELREIGNGNFLGRWGEHIYEFIQNPAHLCHLGPWYELMIWKKLKVGEVVERRMWCSHTCAKG